MLVFPLNLEGLKVTQMDWNLNGTKSDSVFDFQVVPRHLMSYRSKCVLKDGFLIVLGQVSDGFCDGCMFMATQFAHFRQVGERTPTNHNSEASSGFIGI